MEIFNLSSIKLVNNKNNDKIYVILDNPITDYVQSISMHVIWSNSIINKHVIHKFEYQYHLSEKNERKLLDIKKASKKATKTHYTFVLDSAEQSNNTKQNKTQKKSFNRNESINFYVSHMNIFIMLCYVLCWKRKYLTNFVLTFFLSSKRKTTWTVWHTKTFLARFILTLHWLIGWW